MKNIKNEKFRSLVRPHWFAAALFCAVFLSQGTQSQVQAFSDGAPVWSVTTDLGREIHSSSLRGRVTIVNFWATYCIPCIVEFSSLHELAGKYQKNGLNVVAVSVDAQSQAMLLAFADKFKMNYPVAMANPGIMNSFGVSDTVPMTFVLDQQGRVARRHVGYVKKEELEKDVRSLLSL